MADTPTTSDLIERLESAYHVLHCIADTAADEGDRVYFGSTNDPHKMLRQLRVIEKVLAALRARGNHDGEHHG